MGFQAVFWGKCFTAVIKRCFGLQNYETLLLMFFFFKIYEINIKFIYRNQSRLLKIVFKKNLKFDINLIIIELKGKEGGVWGVLGDLITN